MDSKMHRYMQRIDKIMGSNNKSISPLRTAKSSIKVRTNNLDNYLKFELTVKIIGNVIEKNNKLLLTHFFNMIRSC